MSAVRWPVWASAQALCHSREEPCIADSTPWEGGTIGQQRPQFVGL